MSDKLALKTISDLSSAPCWLYWLTTILNINMNPRGRGYKHSNKTSLHLIGCPLVSWLLHPWPRGGHSWSSPVADLQPGHTPRTSAGRRSIFTAWAKSHVKIICCGDLWGRGRPRVIPLPLLCILSDGLIRIKGSLEIKNLTCLIELCGCSPKFMSAWTSGGNCCRKPVLFIDPEFGGEREWVLTLSLFLALGAPSELSSR